MNSKTQQTILLVGNDTTLSYLLGRFAEQSECLLTVTLGNTSTQEIVEVNAKAIIFLSMEYLKDAQSIMAELTNLETPIIVCSSVADEARAGELGADYCLVHPITYDGFQNMMAVVNMPKRP